MLKTDAYTMLALSAHVIKIGEILFAFSIFLKKMWVLMDILFFLIFI